MNKNIFILLVIIITLSICLYDSTSNKSKFKVKMLFDGILNKIIVLLIVVVAMIENFQIGILLMFGVFTVYVQQNSHKPKLIEGFSDYFKTYTR